MHGGNLDQEIVLWRRADLEGFECMLTVWRDTQAAASISGSASDSHWEGEKTPVR
jgi:hypothetical protein